MKRLLITGMNSYIGNEVAAHLANYPGEYEVTKVSLRDDGWKEMSWQAFDSVLHTAAIVHQQVKQDFLYDDVNVNLTVDVAQKAKRDGVNHFMFLSSFSVYGSGADRVVGPLSPTVPNTDYGKSKLNAEKKLHKVADDDFKIAVIRAPLVYGPNCKKGNFPRFVWLAKHTPVFPDVNNSRSMIYSRNLAELIRLLMDDGKGGLFLPQNEKYVDTSNMIRLLAEQQGKKMILSKKMGSIAKWAAKYNKTLNKLFGDAHYDLDECDCGYKYCLYDFEESIRASFGNHKTFSSMN